MTVATTRYELVDDNQNERPMMVIGVDRAGFEAQPSHAHDKAHLHLVRTDLGHISGQGAEVQVLADPED